MNTNNANNMTSIDPSLILNLTLNEYLDRVLGNVEFIDDIYMFAMTSMNALGSYLNLVSIYIFFRKEFKKPVYNYFRILAINSFIHTFMGFFYALSCTARYIPYRLQLLATWYQTIYIPFHYFFFYNSSLTEIAISLDRLKVLNKSFKRVLKIKQKTIIIFNLISSALVGVSSGFLYYPTELYWYSYVNNAYVKIGIYYLLASSFAQTQLGSIYVILFEILSNNPILVGLIVLNVTLLVSMRIYFKSSMNRTEMTTIENNIITQTTIANQIKRRESLKKRTAIMCIFLTTISIISRTVTTAGVIMYLTDPANPAGIFVLAFADFFIFATSFSTFIAFVSFNKMYRSRFVKIYGDDSFHMHSSTTFNIRVDARAEIESQF
jgi:hypothetical protein